MNIIIDTDPGGDDAIALMWLASLCHQQRITLGAVTTAAGNVGADKTWRNAHGLLKLCAIEGAAVAIGDEVEQTRNAAEIHGEDGLGGLAEALPPAPSCPSRPHAAALLRERLAGAVNLLAVAPLTNLAQAEASAPGILSKADGIIIMGGALEAGNVTPAAEFNFYFDPAAAARTLKAANEARLVTLETSSALRLDDVRTREITRGLEVTPAAHFFRNLCAFMARRDAIFSGRSSPGFPVHDAATVAWLAYPELFEARELGLTVDVEMGAARGRLRQSDSADASMCQVATRVDADGLLDIMGRDLRVLFELLHAETPD